MRIYPDSSAAVKVVRICVGFIVFSFGDITELLHCLIHCHVVRQNMIVYKKLNAMASTSVRQRNHGLQHNSQTSSQIVGHGHGSVVGSVSCIRKVAGSNPTLAAI